MSSADKWINDFETYGNSFYVNIVAAATLQKEDELRELEAQVEYVRSKAIGEARNKLKSEAQTQNLSRVQLKAREAYLLAQAYSDLTEYLIPEKSDELIQNVDVDADKFHVEIIKLATTGIDFPDKRFADDAEKIIKLIKASLQMKGQQALGETIFVQGALFGFNRITKSWFCILRVLAIDVNQELIQVATSGGDKGAGANQGKVKMTMNVSYNDYKFNSYRGKWDPTKNPVTDGGNEDNKPGKTPKNPINIHVDQVNLNIHK